MAQGQGLVNWSSRTRTRTFLEDCTNYGSDFGDDGGSLSVVCVGVAEKFVT